MKEEIIHKQILNASSNGVIATDANGCIVFINTQAKKLLGFDKYKISQTYLPDILPLTGPLVIKCLKTGNPQLGRQIIGKHMSLVVNITPIRIDNQLKGAVCSFQGMREFEIVAKKLEFYKNLNKQLETIFKSSCGLNIQFFHRNGSELTLVLPPSIERLLLQGRRLDVDERNPLLHLKQYSGPQVPSVQCR